ncbi:MAG TPA: DUF192 domain-containing protein [Salinimicrobium sp.]|nr:DUF192 domain-containing protein [Salinimicrobium sp.]
MKIKYFVIGLCTLGVFSCKETNKKTRIDTEEISFTKEGEVYMLKATGDTITRLDVEVADNNYERQTGLMYRSSLGTNQGMIFIFEKEEPRGFYMKNTNIPLDLVFLDSEKKVVNIAKDAVPQSMETIRSTAPAKYVLEVNAGLSETWNLEAGDKIIFNKQ